MLNGILCYEQLRCGVECLIGNKRNQLSLRSPSRVPYRTELLPCAKMAAYGPPRATRNPPRIQRQVQPPQVTVCHGWRKRPTWLSSEPSLRWWVVVFIHKMADGLTLRAQNKGRLRPEMFPAVCVFWNLNRRRYWAKPLKVRGWFRSTPKSCYFDQFPVSTMVARKDGKREKTLKERLQVCPSTCYAEVDARASALRTQSVASLRWNASNKPRGDAKSSSR